jgi:Tfp pilus assembly protein PilF
VWAFLILAPLYYEPRFGLFLAAPVALLGTALIFRPTSPPGSRGSTMVAPAGRRRILLTAGTLLVVGAGLYQGMQLGRSLRQYELSAVPAYLAGEVLKGRSQEPGGVCARKPHVAFVADRPLIGFPETPLESLADSLRARGAAFLFYGVVELELVSRYAGLMSPETIPQGLRPIHLSGGIPFGILFRVEPTTTLQPLAPKFRAALDQIRGELERTGYWKLIQDRRAIDAFQEGSFLVSRRRYLEAIPLLQAVVAQDSTLANAHYQLGMAQVETGRAVEGLHSLEKGLSLGFESAELWLYMGRAHQALKDLAKARRALLRALELNPQLGPASFFLGLAEADAGRYDEAERLLSRSLTQGVAEDEGFLDGRARILIMAGKLREADSLLAIARTRYPNSLNIRIMSGITALRSGRVDEARRYLQKDGGAVGPGNSNR